MKKQYPGEGATSRGVTNNLVRGVDMNQRTCEIDGCSRAHVARGYCRRHYRRWDIYGDPLGKAPSRFIPRTCKVAGCGTPLEPMRNARGMCFSHYSRTLRTGSPERQCETCSARLHDAARFCSNECRPACTICGQGTTGTPPRGYSHLCSVRCVGLFRRFGVSIPRETACSRCGMQIQLFEKSPSGRWRKLTRLVCDDCVKRRWNGRVMTVAQLAKRDGIACQLCLSVVRLSLSGTGDLMRPSVDHIQPRSLGGSDDPENLQLAHLLCNMRKGNRPTAVA